MAKTADFGTNEEWLAALKALEAELGSNAFGDKMYDFNFRYMLAGLPANGQKGVYSKLTGIPESEVDSVKVATENGKAMTEMQEWLGEFMAGVLSKHLKSPVTPKQCSECLSTPPEDPAGKEAAAAVGKAVQTAIGNASAKAMAKVKEGQTEYYAALGVTFP